MFPTTKISSFLFSASALLLSSSELLAKAQLRDDIEFTWNSVKMPFPVSDVMANYMDGGPNGISDDDEDGFVIITGGCNSVNGNERIEIDGQDLFTCTSTSNATLKFDPFANAFTTMAEMPHARQRHAAAVAQGELYVFGGRDSVDNLVPAIDSFNPYTNTWTTRGELPADMVTSDLTAWSYQDRYIYISGGFIANYTAVGTTYRLDMSGGEDGDIFPFPPTTHAAMEMQMASTSPHPRGDFHAVSLHGYAYLAGGISHTSDWCTGLRTTERYHMATDTWQTLPDLNVGRADMAVAALNGKIVAMGGETKPENCIDVVSDPAYGSFPADHVEVLLNPNAADPSEAQWVHFEDFVDQRFRFAAAVVPAQDRIYTFGGQLPFDFTCDCFPTSDDIGIGTEVYKAAEDTATTNNNSNSSSLSSAAIAGIVIGALFFVACVLVLLQQTSIINKGQQLQSTKKGTDAPRDFEPTEREHETA